MKTTLVLFTFFLFVSCSYAQGPANMNDYSFRYGSFTFHDKDCDYFIAPLKCYESRRMRLEIPPWQIAGSWHTYFFSNGSETNTYSDRNDMIHSSSVNMEGHGPYFACGAEPSKPWKRDYGEIFSAHKLQHPAMGLINIGFCHGENKDWCGSHNSINPARPLAPSNPCGTTDYDAYFTFPHVVWTVNNEANNWGQRGYTNELGPIGWPANGYIDANNESASEGLSHCSSIVVGDYIYLFLYDRGPRQTPQEGRERGIKLVRVHQNNCLDPAAYEVYYKDPTGIVHWQPSLPAGFTKETMMDYLKVQGPKCTNILPDLFTTSSRCLRFSVAQVTGSNYFIGCEEYLADDERGSDGHENHHVALRFSYDLIHWTERKAIVETAENWDASHLTYPIFLSANGWSNTAIELNDFYILGMHSISNGGFPNWVTRLHVTNLPVDNSQERTPFVYPNPGSGTYNLTYTLQTAAKTQLTVFDQMGRPVQQATAVNKIPGTYTETVNFSTHAKGVYLLVLLVDGKKQTFKVIYQ